MLFPVCIIDDFLGSEAAGTLLAFAQEQQAHFAPSTISSNGVRDVLDTDFRASLSFAGDFGTVLAPFHARLHERLDEIAQATQTRRFDPEPRSLAMVAHCHGHRFRRLVIHALAGDERQVIAPQHDRLVVFPSIAPHEITPVDLPGNAFADARFTIVSWLHRSR